MSTLLGDSVCVALLSGELLMGGGREDVIGWIDVVILHINALVTEARGVKGCRRRGRRQGWLQGRGNDRRRIRRP